jgi:hypothetical protein
VSAPLLLEVPLGERAAGAGLEAALKRESLGRVGEPEGGHELDVDRGRLPARMDDESHQGRAQGRKADVDFGSRSCQVRDAEATIRKTFEHSKKQGKSPTGGPRRRHC